MDVYYDLPPDLPRHQLDTVEPRPARVLATWPVGTFIENLLVRANGEILVSVHSENRLEQIGIDGSHTVLVQLPAPPTSLIELDDVLFVFGGVPGQPPGYLWRVGSDARVDL